MMADQHIDGAISLKSDFCVLRTQQDVFSAAQKDLSIPKSICPCRNLIASPKLGHL